MLSPPDPLRGSDDPYWALGRNMKIRIIGLEPDRAWTNYGGSVRQQLLVRLQSACPSISQTDLKRTARAILKGEVSEFSIEKDDQIERIGQFFESIGVVINIQNEKGE